MKDGCVLSEKKKCKIYGIECWGASDEKSKCPQWGKVYEYEIYLNYKFEYEKEYETLLFNKEFNR